MTLHIRNKTAEAEAVHSAAWDFLYSELSIIAAWMEVCYYGEVLAREIMAFRADGGRHTELLL